MKAARPGAVRPVEVDDASREVPKWLHNGAQAIPNLSIKNVPESVLTKLRERAARHHRSIQGELMALLAAAVEPATRAPDVVAAREKPQGHRSGTRSIEEIAAEHRKRWKKPFARGPRAAAVIRAERDAR